MGVNRLTTSQFKDYVYDHLPSYYREQDALIGKPLWKFLSVFDDGAFNFVIEDANGILDIVDPEKTPSVVLPYLFKSYGLEIFNGIPETYSRAMLAIIGTLWKYKGTTTVIRYLTSLVAGVKTTIEEDESTLTVTLDMDFEVTNEGDSRLPSRENLVRIIDEFLPFYAIAVIVYLYHFSDDIKANMTDKLKDKVKIEGNEVILLGMDEKDLMKIHMALIEEEQSVSFKTKDTLTNTKSCVTNSTFTTNSIGSYDKIKRNGVLTPEFRFTIE